MQTSKRLSETAPHTLFIRRDTFTSVQPLMVRIINAVFQLIAQSSFNPCVSPDTSFDVSFVYLEPAEKPST